MKTIQATKIKNNSKYICSFPLAELRREAVLFKISHPDHFEDFFMVFRDALTRVKLWESVPVICTISARNPDNIRFVSAPSKNYHLFADFEDDFKEYVFDAINFAIKDGKSAA